MFGRNKLKTAAPSNKAAPSNTTNDHQETGAIIQGFVCPICLLSFSSSSDLEVHFQMNHDKPKMEDDEVALMQHQLAASEQTRDLMQREISRQLETIQALEQNVTSLTSSRNDAEVSLQKTLLELSSVQQSLESERKICQETAEAKETLQRNLVELQGVLATRPDPAYVEQLQAKCEDGEKLALLQKCEAERVVAEHVVEVAKLQDTLLSVQKSYKDFMDSLSHLLTNIESLESNDSYSRPDLAPECASLLEMFSSELKKQFEDKDRLRAALHEHELVREKFVEEKRKLEEQLVNLEKMQSRTRSKLVDLSKYICHNSSDSPPGNIQMDDIGLLDAINRSFDSLHAKNAQLQSEIEHNVSDEEVLQRLKQEYEETIEEKCSEMSSLQSDFGVAKNRLVELEPAYVEMKQQLERLEAQFSALTNEKAELLTAIEAQDRLIHFVLERFGDTPLSLEKHPRVEEEQFTKMLDAVTERTEELQAELSSSKSALENRERTFEEQKRAVEQELAAKSETISRLEAALNEHQAESSKLTLSLEEEMRKLKVCFDDLQQGHDASLQTIHSLTNEKNQTGEKATRLESELQEQKLAMDQELSVKNETISRLEAALQEKEAEASKNGASLASLEVEMGIIKVRFDELQQTYDATLQMTDLLTSERDIINEKITQLESQLEEARLLLEESRSLTSGKESEIAGLIAELETMKSRHGDTESRFQAVASEKSELVKRLIELEQQLSSVVSENKRISEQCSSLAASLTSCQEKLTVTEQSLVETNAQKEKTRLDFEQLRSEFESTKSSLSDELAKANSALEELQVSLDKERLTSSQLNADVRLAQEACRNLESTNSQLNLHYKEVTAELGSFRIRCEELEQNVAKLKVENLAETTRLKNECEKQLESKESFLRMQSATTEAKLRAEMAGLIARLEQSQNESQDLEEELNELQRRYQELQLALQELGREQQNLQIKHVKIKEHRWQDDSEATSCRKCDQRFSVTTRRHHCRNCGLVFCATCSSKTALIGASRKPVRVCDNCHKDLQDL